MFQSLTKMTKSCKNATFLQLFVIQVWSGYIYIYFCPTGFCYLSLVAIVASAVLIPFYIRLTSSHPSTKRALISGWLPLILAATISSGGGIILASVHMKHPAFALLQPVLVGKRHLKLCIANNTKERCAPKFKNTFLVVNSILLFGVSDLYNTKCKCICIVLEYLREEFATPSLSLQRKNCFFKFF